MSKLSNLKRVPYSKLDQAMGHVFFELIKIGDITISIQASVHHYCLPRKSKNIVTNEILEAKDYSAFEIELSKNGEVINPNDDPCFAQGSWAKYWGSDDAAGYVPRQDVENMIADIEASYLSHVKNMIEDIKASYICFVEQAPFKKD